MPTPLPAPPKRRGAPSGAAGTKGMANWGHATPTMAYDSRIKWNLILLVLHLLLAQVGLWTLVTKLLANLVGETTAWIVDWLVVLVPLINVAEALCARAKKPPPPAVAPEPQRTASPMAKRIQSYSTTVPASILNSSPLPRALDSSRKDTPSRRDAPMLELSLPHNFTPNTSTGSGFSSPSPSARARERMQRSAASSANQPVRVPDLFDSRDSSLEPVEERMTSSVTRHRRREGSSREPSPFSISSLPVKKEPKAGKALHSSSLRGLVS